MLWDMKTSIRLAESDEPDSRSAGIYKHGEKSVDINKER